MAGVELFGVSADSPERLARFRAKLGIPFTLLSDPQLTSADVLGVATSSRHPMASKYPRGAFLQPGLFVWRRDGSEVHRWVQKPGMLNFYGAAGRPSPEQIVEIVTAL